MGDTLGVPCHQIGSSSSSRYAVSLLCCNHVRFFFFALTPIAKSTIMGAKTSTGIGHNTELTSFLIVPASRSESRCHRQGCEEMRSPALAHEGRAARPNLEMKSSHRQTTCSLSPLSRFRY